MRRRRYRPLELRYEPPRLFSGRGLVEATATIASVSGGLCCAIVSRCDGPDRIFGVMLVSSLTLIALGELVICLYRHRRRTIASQRTSRAWSIGSEAPVNTNARLS